MITIQKKTIFFKYFFLLVCIVEFIFPLTTIAYNFSDKKQITKSLQYAQQQEYIDDHQKIIIDSLQSVLYLISETKFSNIKIKEYQKIMDDILYTTLQLLDKNTNIPYQNIYFYKNLSDHALKQKLFQINHQLTDLLKQLKPEYYHKKPINASLPLLLQPHDATNNTLNNLKQQQILYTNINTPIKQSKFIGLQSKQIINQLKMIKLKLDQLSTSNHKELSQLHMAFIKKKYNYIDNELYILKHQLNHLYKKETNQPIEYTKKISSEQHNTLPKSIKKQLQTNIDLAIILNQQKYYMNNIALKKQEVTSCISQLRQTFDNLLEQAQWLDKSPVLGETLRSQVAKLPEIPKFQQLDHDMKQLRTKRLQYEHQLNKLTTPSLLSCSQQQDDGTPLTLSQKHILETQLITQRDLITSLLNSFDTQILELTKLKVAYKQLKEVSQDIQKAIHRHLFWVADIPPITVSYPLDIYQDLYKLFTMNEFRYQIISSFKIIFTNHKTLILIILCTIISIGLHFITRRHYQEFLERSSKKINKVNQDNFFLTFHNIWYSMLIAVPIPMLWAVIGYSLSHAAWLYPISVAISDGINATTFILWICVVSHYFASSKGLFIAHFGWQKKRIQQVFSDHYKWSVGTIVFLIMMLTIFNNYNDREFSNTLGRLCFILLCIYLTFITNNLKRSGLPLYLNKYDSSNNIINHFLWNIMICAPTIAAISCILGYLFSSQELLARLEKSLFIWIILLIIYHMIRRWTSIQRRRIAFERAKQKRVTQLALRAHNEINSSQLHTNKLTSNNENNKKILDLDTISTQSLQLIRSIVTIIALLLMTLLWSELRFAFSFLENITLWDVTSTIKGVDNIQPITLNSFLIAIFVIIITTKIVKNLPAFLELTFLQHLNLAPGTGYAITTLTKYILMFLGGIIGCSLIGIEWTKIQWLIAALGVGLGFGLQEIFANLISGLMILFEKPIRIGDTVTINKLTGNITRINTRATIITDWNHKEIIIPNKEFITKKFINWSLSDTLTRVVLHVPAPFKTDMKKIVQVLLQIVQNSSFALNTPPPEVYLVDLQQGLPMFEIRIHISDLKLRMPLCHQIHMLIVEYYQNNNLTLPYIPIYPYNNQLFTNNFDSHYPNTNYHTTK